MVKLTASSQIHSPYQAHNAVKNSYGWQSSIRNDKQWLQVDLGKKTDVKGIITQGRLNANYWVKAYTISYSDDGTNFEPYKNNKVWNQLMTFPLIYNFQTVSNKCPTIFWSLVFRISLTTQIQLFFAERGNLKFFWCENAMERGIW